LGLFYLFVWFQTQNRQNEKTRQAREERDHFEPAGGRKKNEFLVMHASELQTRAKEKKKKKNHKSNICAIVDAVI
jgi:hypothetical protein